MVKYKNDLYKNLDNDETSYRKKIVFKNRINVLEPLGDHGWVLEISKTKKNYPIYYIILYYNLFHFTNKHYRVINHNFFESDENGWSKALLWEEVEDIIYKIQESNTDPSYYLNSLDLIV